MTTNKDEGPATRSAAYAAMAPSWDKIDSLLGGTKTMRARGTAYLPRHEEEKEIRYKERLDRATLHNITKMTLEGWVGRPFSEPMTIGEDVPEEIEAVLKDVDLRGNAVGTFSRTWFREGVGKGLAHVLIEYPMKPAGVEQSRQDDYEAGRRPYWCFVKPENLLYASSEIRDGREILVQVRILETHRVQEEWGEREVRRIRVLRRGVSVPEAPGGQIGNIVTFEIWEYQEKEDVWILQTPPTRMDINEIPFVTFYADQKGFMESSLPLEDLADLNIAHWQSSSDQTAVLTVARFPILAVKGEDLEEKGKSPIGPFRALSTRDPAGLWYYVEHSGAAIAAGRQDLLDLEERMASYGAEFLKRRPGSPTATARALDSAEATSPLEDAVVRFNDALAQALYFTGKWMGIDEPGTIAVPTDLGPETVEGADFDILKASRATREISRVRYLEELKRRGVLASDFDVEKDAELLAGENFPDAGPAVDSGAPV